MLHYITLHYITLYYITLCILQHITLHYIILLHIILPYIVHITLHYIILHYYYIILVFQSLRRQYHDGAQRRAAGEPGDAFPAPGPPVCAARRAPGRTADWASPSEAPAARGSTAGSGSPSEQWPLVGPRSTADSASPTER